MTRKLFDMDVTYVRNLVHEYVYIYYDMHIYMDV